MLKLPGHFRDGASTAIDARMRRSQTKKSIMSYESPTRKNPVNSSRFGKRSLPWIGSLAGFTKSLKALSGA